MTRDVSNFVTDLVEMARATEELPVIREQLEHAQREIERLRETVQHRELRIIDLKTEIDVVNSKLQAAEVARDDAELRFLEADDKTAKVRELVTKAASLVKLPEPPPPPVTAEPLPANPIYPQTSAPEVAQPDPTPAGSTIGTIPETPAISATEGQSVVDPTSAPTTPSSAAPTSTEVTSTAASFVERSSIEGESAAHPTVSSGTDAGPAQSPSAPEVAASSGTLTEPPYSGQRYYDWPRYVSLTDWLAGGGTKDDYYWRPWGSALAQA